MIDNREKSLRKQLLKLPKLIKIKKKLILDSKSSVNEKDINAKKINYTYHSQTAKSEDKEKIWKAGRGKKTQAFR